MNMEMGTIRLLGAVQLLVFVASLVSERLLESVVGSGGISDKLVNIANNLIRMRISNLVALINCLAIVVLGVLFYSIFHEDYKIISLLALVCFLAEAITLAVSKIGTLALIQLSQEFVEADAPESSYLPTLGDFLYYGIDRGGYDIHMFFFCVGGILWYSLLVSSRVVPTALSVWGVVAISLLTISVLMILFNRDLKQFLVLGVFYAPYEVVLGVWLVVKGFI
jgi:hypothetical protein